MVSLLCDYHFNVKPEKIYIKTYFLVILIITLKSVTSVKLLIANPHFKNRVKYLFVCTTYFNFWYSGCKIWRTQEIEWCADVVWGVVYRGQAKVALLPAVQQQRGKRGKLLGQFQFFHIERCIRPCLLGGH